MNSAGFLPNTGGLQMEWRCGNSDGSISYRSLIASGAYSITVPTTQLAPLTRHLTQLRAGIENAQGVLEKELQRLQRGVRETAEDKAVIAAFREATKD